MKMESLTIVKINVMLSQRAVFLCNMYTSCTTCAVGKQPSIPMINRGS